jgi:hypothetical protein
MKNTLFFSSLLLCLAGIIALTSCSNSSDPVLNNTPIGVQNTVQTGSWRITSFVDKGNDETSHFSGYTFNFGSNSVLTSTNGSSSFTGTWSITDNNSNDDNISDLHFNIQFNLTNDFKSLNEDWQMVSRTSTRIELTHVSGGNGGTAYLTFEKS